MKQRLFIFILLFYSFALAFAETDDEQEPQNIVITNNETSEAADSPSEVNFAYEYISRLEK